MSVTVRAFEAADWPQLWPAFDEIVADGDTYALPAGLTSERALAWWVQPPPDSAWVALDDDGTVLGTVRIGPVRPGRGAHVATAAFVVLPAARGRGVGRTLGGFALERARAEGYTAMQFNAVVETNTVAVALWRSLGFTIVGTVPQAFDHPDLGLVGLHVMHRLL